MYNKKTTAVFFPKSTTLIYFVRLLLQCIKIEKNRLAALERCLKVLVNSLFTMVLDISEVILKNYILWNLEYGI